MAEFAAGGYVPEDVYIEIAWSEEHGRAYVMPWRDGGPSAQDWIINSEKVYDSMHRIESDFSIYVGGVVE